MIENVYKRSKELYDACDFSNIDSHEYNLKDLKEGTNLFFQKIDGPFFGFRAYIDFPSDILRKFSRGDEWEEKLSISIFSDNSDNLSITFGLQVACKDKPPEEGFIKWGESSEYGLNKEAPLTVTFNKEHSIIDGFYFKYNEIEKKFKLIKTGKESEISFSKIFGGAIKSMDENIEINRFLVNCKKNILIMKSKLWWYLFNRFLDKKFIVENDRKFFLKTHRFRRKSYKSGQSFL